MKTIPRFLVCILLSAALAGCASLAQQFEPGDGSWEGGQKGFSAAPAFSRLDNWLNQNMLVVTAGQDGRMDYDRSFAQGAVIAYGEGAPSNFDINPGQKRFAAQQAAEAVAQRNMAEFFARHARNGEVRFVSYAARLDALLKGAVVVADDYDPVAERAAVLLKIDLRGAKGFAR